MAYSQQFEVLAHDVDAKDNARPTAIIRYMQETADHQMRDETPSYAQLFAQNKAFIVSKITVKVFQPLCLYDKLTVSSWPVEPRGVIFMRYYTIEREGICIAQGIACWVLVDTLTKKFLGAKDVDYNNYTKAPPLDNLQIERVNISPQTDMVLAGRRTVSYAEVDRNGHMNNTNYADMFCDFIPNMPNRNIKSISLHYKKEAKLHSPIDVYLSSPMPTDRGTVVYMARTLIGAEVNCEAQIEVDGTDE